MINCCSFWRPVCPGRLIARFVSCLYFNRRLGNGRTFLQSWVGFLLDCVVFRRVAGTARAEYMLGDRVKAICVYQGKRRVGGIGIVLFWTHSQTLNGHDPVVTMPPEINWNDFGVFLESISRFEFDFRRC